jgi:hypothetical protein
MKESHRTTMRHLAQCLAGRGVGRSEHGITARTRKDSAIGFDLSGGERDGEMTRMVRVVDPGEKELSVTLCRVNKNFHLGIQFQDHDYSLYVEIV